jgi:uncharacterized protein (TIGR02145 family)
MQTTKNNLKLFIAQNRIEEAIDILLKQTNFYLSENKDDKMVAKISEALLINSGKLNGLIHDQNLGILSFEEAKITKAEVQKAILYVIDQLPDTVFEFEKYSENKADFSRTEQSRLREGVKLLKETQSDFEFDIFLSFSSKDRDEARKIWEKLRGYGLQVFLSDEALKIDIGTSFSDKIQYALYNSRHLVLLCTPDAMQSNYVKIETDAFFNQFFIKSQVGQRRLIILKGKGFEMEQLPLFYKSLQLAESVEQIIDALVNKTIIEQKEIEKNQQDEELKMRKKLEEIEYLKQQEWEALEAEAIEEFERLKKEEQQRLEKEKELRQIQIAKEKERKEKEEKERKATEENERLKKEKEEREKLEKENELKEMQAAKERKEKEERETAIAEEKKRREQELQVRQADWDKCREINALFAYETFVSNYQDGLYIEEAKAEIEKIKARQIQKETEETKRIEQERLEKERELKQKQAAEAKERQEKVEKERKTAEENERLKKEKAEQEKQQKNIKLEEGAEDSSNKNRWKIIVFGLAGLLILIFLIWQPWNSRSIEAVRYGEFADSRDGKVYKTIKIGNQVWMADNLAFKTDSGCRADDNLQNNLKKYGYLYDWQTAKKVCPKGWHLPTKEDFETLINNAGNGDAAYELLVKSYISEFNGQRQNDGTTDVFFHLGYGTFWSSSPSEYGTAWCMSSWGPYGGLCNQDRCLGISVRCLKDN